MAGQGQQIPGQGQQIPGQGQQTIIVMQAPASGRRGRQFQPEMKRGTEFCGHHIKGPCISCMAIVGVLGIILSLQGITMWQLNGWFLLITILGFPASVTCLVMGCCAGRKAKREWDALPLDHPDRIKYCGVAALTVPIQQQPGGYNVPPGNYPQPSPGGYNQPPSGAYNQPPSGAYNSPPVGYNQPPPGPYSQPPGGSGFGNYSYQPGQPLPPGQPGASPTKYHFQDPQGLASAPPPPDTEDPPPSYDQITK